MAKRFEARKIEETAIALYGVNEAENAVEASAIVGICFPGDNFPAQSFEHFPAFGHEIGNKIVHWWQGPTQISCEALYAAKELTPR
jgi:hypothetical protein